MEETIFHKCAYTKYVQISAYMKYSVYTHIREYMSIDERHLPQMCIYVHIQKRVFMEACIYGKHIYRSMKERIYR
jgi:hypothetical protein